MSLVGIATCPAVDDVVRTYIAEGVKFMPMMLE
jgi:hypothetical protein